MPDEASISTTIEPTGHEGSASMQPSGGWVVSAWAVSIVLHIFLFIGMLAMVFPYGAPEKPTGPVVHAQVVGEVDGQSLEPSQLPDLSKSAQAQPVAPQELRFEPKQLSALAMLESPKRPELPIIGIGAGGADFAKYGLSAGGPRAPEFFGLGRTAKGVRTIVYVVDRSASMLGTFEQVRDELKRSISELRRSQRFHVIFFNSGPPLESPPGRPVGAIRAYKERFFEFLDSVHPSGRTRPQPAMHRALAVEPDLIYFLTDGIFDPGLLDRLREWNADKKVRIYTIAYVDSSGAALLERIAHEHGGEFKFVSEYDLP